MGNYWLDLEKKYLKSQVLAKADVPNKNNRIYPKHVLERAAADFNKDKVMFGTVGVESNPVQLASVSHVVEDLRFVGNELFADVKILDTEPGKILSNLLNEGKIVFKMGGTASTKVNEDGVTVVGDNFILKSIVAVLV